MVLLGHGYSTIHPLLWNLQLWFWDLSFFFHDPSHLSELFAFRTLGDKLGEAKASGNLGNTLKVLGKFEEAIACCERHLDISRELTDKVWENAFIKFPLFLLSISFGFVFS